MRDMVEMEQSKPGKRKGTIKPDDVPFPQYGWELVNIIPVEPAKYIEHVNGWRGSWITVRLNELVKAVPGPDSRKPKRDGRVARGARAEATAAAAGGHESVPQPAATRGVDAEVSDGALAPKDAQKGASGSAARSGGTVAVAAAEAPEVAEVHSSRGVSSTSASCAPAASGGAGGAGRGSVLRRGAKRKQKPSGAAFRAERKSKRSRIEDFGGQDPSDGANRELPEQDRVVHGGDALSDVVGPGAADRGACGNQEPEAKAFSRLQSAMQRLSKLRNCQLNYIHLAQRNTRVDPNFGVETAERLQAILDRYPDEGLTGGWGPGNDELRERDWFRLGSFAEDGLQELLLVSKAVQDAVKLFREAKQKRKKETHTAKKKDGKTNRQKKSQARAAHGKTHMHNVKRWVQACAQANREMGVQGRTIPTRGSPVHDRAKQIMATS